MVLRAAMLLLAFNSALSAQAPYARALANDNRTPAGSLQNGVLTLHLDIVRANWRPDRAEDPGLDLYAFAEAGHAPSVPGPLIRVPAGTEIRTTIRNTLSDSSLLILGLSGSRRMADSVRVQPGETRELVTRVSEAGTFLYRALTRMPFLVGRVPETNDALLAGALIVDVPGAQRADRVFVVQMWEDTLRLPRRRDFVNEVNVINGKSWPYTERLSYQLGDTIRWRWVNATFSTHPLHLHGAYFNVLSRGTMARDTLYGASETRQTVTERVGPLTTMALQWVPLHAGNWVFHCHLTPHILPHVPLEPMKASGEHDAMEHGMGGLIIGLNVQGPVDADVPARRRLRLFVEQYDSLPGDLVPRFSYELDDTRKLSVPGPPIIVQRDEPVAIAVINRTKEPTSVHWHGLEIQSYYDGVPNFGGDATRSTPLVAPNDSFVVQMTPPRAGTFIYHTHAREERQQQGGLYGAFIVLDKGAQWDADHERLFVIGTRRDNAGAVLVNGGTKEIAMKAGETYRLRMINITIANPSITVALMRHGANAQWQLLARDGADLPAAQQQLVPAVFDPFTLGQTWDVRFRPEPGDYAFVIRNPLGDVVAETRIVVR